MCTNKIKVGDVVKCVHTGVFNNLTTGKGYKVVEVSNDDMVKVKNDKGIYFYYYSYRFELSDDSANAQQTPKFKEGDMVYLIGFGYFKPCELLQISNMQFKVVMDNGSFQTFTEDGKYLTIDLAPSIVLATEENRQMLNKLLGVEYEPVKLTGSDLARKLLKDNPQTCWVSDVSDNYAVSNSSVSLVMKFENGIFTSKSGTEWKFAVPCDQHGIVLRDE